MNLMIVSMDQKDPFVSMSSRLKVDDGDGGTLSPDNLYVGSSGEEIGVSESSDIPVIVSFPETEAECE